MLPTTPAARLGTVSHRLLEEAGRGDFERADTEALERRWDELVASSDQSAASSWLDRHLVPLNLAVPDYEVRKLKTLSKATMLAARAKAIPQSGGGVDAVLVGSEVPVASPDGAAAGRIDAIVPGADGPVIRDYKSGAIYEAQGGPDRMVKEEYAAQLRLYAAIYALMTSRWPSRLEVVPLQGEPVIVTFTRAECLRLLNQAIRLREDINRVIESAAPLADRIDRLASPAPRTCSYCGYRPQCGPYMSGLQAPRGPSWPSDAVGQLTELRTLGNGRRALGMATGTIVTWVRGISSVRGRHPALELAKPGDVIGAFNLRPAGSDSSFTEGPFTVFYKLAPPEHMS